MPALAVGLVGLALIGIGIALSGSEGRRILADDELWKQGAVAPWAEVSGEETTQKFLWHDYDLDVTYTDLEGGNHTAKTEFETFPIGANTNQAPEVRYDPNVPERVTVSWAIDASTWRWASCGSFLLVGILLGPLMVWYALISTRAYLDVRACSLRSEEVLLEVLRVKDAFGTGSPPQKEYEYAGHNPWGGTLHGKFTSHPKMGGPLFVDATRTKILALVSPERPQRAVVVHDSLLPFEFTASQQGHIRESMVRSGSRG
jgi:hypothetical protein